MSNNDNKDTQRLNTDKIEIHTSSSNKEEKVESTSKKSEFASLEEAERHGKANRIYKPGTGKGEACPCCDLKEGEPFKLTEDIISLGTHGALRSGYVLYFRFIKHSGILLSVIFVFSGIFNIISNLAANDCEPNGTKITETDPRLCARDFITIFTIANKKDHDELMAGQAVLNLICLLFMLCYFHYMRIDFRLIVLKEDEADTPSDYTLRIDGLKSVKENEDIEAYFNKFFSGKEAVHVVNVNRTYKISEYVRSKFKLERYQKKLREIQSKFNLEDDARKKDIENKRLHIHEDDTKSKEKEEKKIKAVEDVDVRIKAIEDMKIEHYQRKVKKHNAKILEVQSKGLEYGSSFFVTFQYPEEAQRVMEECNSGRLMAILCRKKRIKATRAPEPNEVIWENVGVPSKKKLKVRILGWGIFFLLIAASFGVILGLNYIQITAANELGVNSPVVQFLSIISSVLIMVINFFLEQAFLKVSKYEKKSTYMDYFTEFTERLTLAQLLNTGFITLITKILVRRALKVDFFSPGGLLNQMNYVFLLNAVVQPTIALIDIPAWLKTAKIILFKQKGPHAIQLDQTQLNKLHEATYFTVTQRYASINKTVFLTCFYATASPLLVLYSIIGIIYKYWAEKYVFIRKSSKPNPLGYGLNKEMMEVFEWNALCFAIGQVYVAINLNSISTGTFGLTWAILIISIINIYLPMEAINEKIMPDEAIMKWKKITSPVAAYKKPYSIQKFETDYEIENLVTRKRALDRQSKMEGLGITEMKRVIVNDDLRHTDFFASLDRYYIEANLSSEILTNHKPPKKPQRALDVVTNLLGGDRNKIKILGSILLKKIFGDGEDQKMNTSISSPRKDEIDQNIIHTTQGNESIMMPSSVDLRPRDRPSSINPIGKALFKNLQRQTSIQSETEIGNRRSSISFERQNSGETAFKSPKITSAVFGLEPSLTKEKPKALIVPKNPLQNFLGGLLKIDEGNEGGGADSARIKPKKEKTVKRQKTQHSSIAEDHDIESQRILPGLLDVSSNRSHDDKTVKIESMKAQPVAPLSKLKPEEINAQLKIQERTYEAVVDSLFSPTKVSFLGNENILKANPNFLFDANRFADTEED